MVVAIVVLIVVLILAGVLLLLKKKGIFLNNSKDEDKNVMYSAAFYNSEEFIKIVDNKEKIIKVFKVSMVDGKEEAVPCSKRIIYNIVKNIKILRKTKAQGDDYSYVFQFDDGTSARINFQGKYLRYAGINYIIKKSQMA